MVVLQNLVGAQSVVRHVGDVFVRFVLPHVPHVASARADVCLARANLANPLRAALTTSPTREALVAANGAQGAAGLSRWARCTLCRALLRQRTPRLSRCSSGLCSRHEFDLLAGCKKVDDGHRRFASRQHAIMAADLMQQDDHASASPRIYITGPSLLVDENQVTFGRRGPCKRAQLPAADVLAFAWARHPSPPQRCRFARSSTPVKTAESRPHTPDTHPGARSTR